MNIKKIFSFSLLYFVGLAAMLSLFSGVTFANPIFSDSHNSRNSPDSRESRDSQNSNGLIVVAKKY